MGDCIIVDTTLFFFSEIVATFLDFKKEIL